MEWLAVVLGWAFWTCLLVFICVGLFLLGARWPRGESDST